MIIKVDWVKLPKTNFEQLRNGTKGIIFKISPQYVGKILYLKKGYEDYVLRDDKDSLEELTHEADIHLKLYEKGIGNVPKPIGIERLGIFGSAYPTLIMEYITLPRGDEINHVERGKATDLAIKECEKAIELGLCPGLDVLNPANFFYKAEDNQVRLIDFGRWFFESSEYQI